MPDRNNHFDRRSYMKLLGLTTGAAVTGTQSGVASAATGSYGLTRYGYGGYGIASVYSAVTVETNRATPVERTSVTLNGALTSLGSASSAEVAFEWGAISTGLENKTTAQLTTAAGEFGTTIDNLDPGTEYVFRAVASGTNGSADTGTTRSFTTDQPLIEVTGETTLLARDARLVNAQYDSNHTGFQGDGFVNFRDTDSSVEWTVNTASETEVDLTVRYAQDAQARTGRLSVAGSTSELVTGSTGSWSTWETTTQRVSLPSGTSTIRIEAVGEDLGNVDAVVLNPVETTTTTSQTLLPSDGDILNAQFDANHDGYQGDGFVNFAAVDSHVEWAVDSDARTDYDLTVRYALGAGDRTGRLTVGDTPQDLTAQSTGSWTTWETTTERVTLEKGTSTIRVEATGEDFGNVDAVYLTAPEEPLSWYTKTLLPRDADIINAMYESNHDGYQGDGFVNFRDADSYAQWSVDNGEAAEFDLTMRYALDGESRTGRLVTDDVQQEITVDATGAWTTWETTTERISLPAGTSVVRVEATGEDFANLDAIDLQRVR